MSEISYVAKLRSLVQNSPFLDPQEAINISKAADAFEELMDIAESLAKYAVCDPLCFVFSPEKRLPCNCGLNDLFARLECYFDQDSDRYRWGAANG